MIKNNKSFLKLHKLTKGTKGKKTKFEKYEEESDEVYQNVLGFESEGIGDEQNNFANEYYLYRDISIDSVMSLLKFIKSAERRWNIFLLENSDIVEKAEPKPLKVFINSEGGDIFAAIPLIDAITNSKIPIHTYIEGIAASAASLISMAGHKRFITSNSFMLVHELRTGVEGTYSNLTDERENCDKLMGVITNFYKNKTSAKFSNELLQSILKRDLILSSNECLEYGLVDEIVQNL
jgi:ATP-dependent Clp protease protease subunit